MCIVNAGARRFTSFADLDDAAMDVLINTNQKSVVWGIKHAMAAMKAAGTHGAILVNSSVAGHVAKSWCKGGALYAATKAGAEMLVQYAAIEGAENSVLPPACDQPFSNFFTCPQQVAPEKSNFVPFCRSASKLPTTAL